MTGTRAEAEGEGGEGAGGGRERERPITRLDPIQCELLYPRSPSTPIPGVEICSRLGGCTLRGGCTRVRLYVASRNQKKKKRK